MAKFCGGCGHEVPEPFKFCQECGTPVSQTPQTFSFEGVANRSLVQQIGTINVGGMTQEQFTALTGQLSQLLERLGVPDQLDIGQASSAPLPQRVREVARVIEKKVDEAQQSFGKPTGDPGLYLRLGNVASKSKNYREAVRYYDKVLDIRYDDNNALCNQGLAFVSLRWFNMAESNFSRILGFRPDDAGARLGLALTLLYLGRRREAVEICDEALAISPNDAATWYSRGVILKKLGREGEAKESFKRADGLRKKGRKWDGKFWK